ncbi:MAG: DUF3089 domain-containing protein [Bacteroidota bacterium]|nr:DUF3089 domain-containing protein [Bacteroidota bacterium]
MNLKVRIFTAIFFFAFFFSACFTPPRNFHRYTPPPLPDYSLEKNWAALPTVKDSADVVPYGSFLREDQANAKVDVFFIHPTMYYKGKSWNADVNDKRTNHLVDVFPMRQQATVFNESCKVYAPRYRQATLASFLNGDGNGALAIDTAYADIKRAFEYYLTNYNHGRPIIIAGHSQGTFLAQKLLHDFFDTDPKMKKLLVAAYLVGGNIGKGSFTTIVLCDSASQTNCYVAWHTREYGSVIKEPKKKQETSPAYQNYKEYTCINPLTWKSDTTPAPASLNPGSVPKKFNRIDVGLVDAKISGQEIIWSHRPEKKGYPKGENYHVYDYSLFYMNIRQNVKERCETYLSKK